MFSNKYHFNKNVVKQIIENNPEYTKVILEPGTELPLEQLKEIVDAILCNQHIQVLVLLEHEMDDEYVEQIIRLKDHDSLKILNVSANNITDAGARKILNQMTRLHHLGLAGNLITDNVTEDIARSSIPEFDLFGANITTEGAKNFFKSSTITSLRLDDELVDSDVYSALQQHFQNNKENLERNRQQKPNANGNHNHSDNHVKHKRLHGEMHRTFSASDKNGHHNGNHGEKHHRKKHHHSHK